MQSSQQQSAQREDSGHQVGALWQKALTDSTPEAREAAAWECFIAARPGVTGLPAFKTHELPIEVRPLLIAAKSRAAGRTFLESLERLSLSSDDAVRKALARALVRLSLSNGEWDRNRARDLLEGLRKCGGKKFKHFIQDAYDELSPKNLNFALRRLCSKDVDETVWLGLTGLGVMTVIGAVIAGFAIATRNSILFTVGWVMMFRWLTTLWKPGQLSNPRNLRRRLELLAQIEAHADEDPDALRRALPELRALSWRLSDEPSQVREAAARLVQRIQATERDARQLPIASAAAASVAESLPVPATLVERQSEPDGA